MNIASINLGNFGSTGHIMRSVSAMAQAAGHKIMICYPETDKNLPKEKNDVIICNTFEKRINEKLAYETGYRGVHGWFSTRRFLHQLDRFSPDIIHLHNLHNNYINLKLLFRYIKKHHIKVVWTLHDCWSFTGQCPHFTMAKCEKWKTGCYDCPSYREYPRSKVDRTKEMWAWKKKWFTGVQDLTIVTPSQWLADLVAQSYLKEYPVKVIHNGIDLSIFKPTQSDFRIRYGISEDKKILLGVAFGWGIKKGLDVFVELSKRLDPDRYQIVLVGTDENIDKQLPDNIISIHRTQNKQELAEIYTATDLFINPTREENFPTVNMEAIACGTPVLTFRTGGSPECIDETCGAVVDCDDIDTMEREIIRITTEKIYDENSCTGHALNFDMTDKFREYVHLYGKDGYETK